MVDFLISKSLQSDVVNLWYFTLKMLANSLSWKYQRFKQSGCKDIGIRKFEFVAKTQFL